MARQHHPSSMRPPISEDHTLAWPHQMRRRIMVLVNQSSKSSCPMRLVRCRSFTNVSNQPSPSNMALIPTTLPRRRPLLWLTLLCLQRRCLQGHGNSARLMFRNTNTIVLICQFDNAMPNICRRNKYHLTPFCTNNTYVLSHSR
jgi:hypothetical protein